MLFTRTSILRVLLYFFLLILLCNQTASAFTILSSSYKNINILSNRQHHDITTGTVYKSSLSITTSRHIFCTKLSSTSSLSSSDFLYTINYSNCIHSFDTSTLCLDTNKDDTLKGLVSNAYESFHVINEAVQRLQDCLLIQDNSYFHDILTPMDDDDDIDNDTKKGSGRKNEKVIMNKVLQDDKVTMKLYDITALSCALVKSDYYINLHILYQMKETKKENNQRDLDFSILWSVTQMKTTNNDAIHGNKSRTSDINNNNYLIITFSHCIGKGGKNDPIQKEAACDFTISFPQTKNYMNIDSVELYHKMTSLELCHEALMKSVNHSCQTIDDVYDNEMQSIINQLKNRLSITFGLDLRGRTSADAAFNLALAGTQNSNDILDSLVLIGIHELQRVGQRSSFKPKYILQMIEKFAVTGASSMKLNLLFSVAASILDEKKYNDTELIHNLYQGNYGLHSDRPLLWLWRFSTRQRKVVPKDLNDLGFHNIHIDWGKVFTNQFNDLVIDLGTGMGVSLLNAASCSRMKAYNHHNDTTNIEWENCNYAGAELNQMMVRYANGIISRFDNYPKERFIQIFNQPCEVLLNNVLSSYNGKVSLIILQFPSPYRFHIDQDSNNKNKQLPISATEGFMVTERLLRAIVEVLTLNGGCGKLLLQTKCEDVAIFMKNLALSTQNLQLIACTDSVYNIDEEVYFKRNNHRPKRVEQWLSYYPMTERAQGIYWSKSSFLPPFARSETEVACDNDGNFVHRCLMECTL